MKRAAVLAISAAVLGLAVMNSQSQDAENTAVEIKLIRAVGAIHPRLSPDGARLAFSLQGAIWTSPSIGGTMTRLSDGEGYDTNPVWSPDGEHIAFMRAPERIGPIVLIRASDGGEVPLRNNVVSQGTIVFNKIEFHPDGRRLLGGLRVDGKNLGLAWYDIESGASKSIVQLERWARFALSQDGKWIVYTISSNLDGEQSGNNGPQVDVMKIPFEGGDPEKIAVFPAKVHDLCWHADGKSIIVVSELEGVHYDLWRVPLDNPLAGMEKWSHGQADETSPSMSKEGRWFAYTDNRAGATAIQLRDLNSGAETTVTFDKIDYGRPTGTLRLACKDAGTGKLTVARVSLQQAGAKYYSPLGELHRALRGVGFFYCDKTAELMVPAGKYALRAFRGPEYNVVYRELDIAPGQTTDLVIDLNRWTHQAKLGWYSGENHIHANYGYGEWYNTPRTMLAQCAGEDLNVCNFMVANSDTDGVFDREFFRGRPDPLSTPETILYWNQEFRSTAWGHMTLVNLKQIVEPVFTGFKNTTNPWDIPTNADIAERTHWQKGHVNYTHASQDAAKPFTNPYCAKGMPIDVAMGRIDSVDINAAWAGTVPIWHRLLNLGFKLPASAGTDCFLNRIHSRLPGGDRVYVKVDSSFDYAGWIKGLREGRSFVTNGPMLEFAVDHQEIGATIKLDNQKKVKVAARALSPWAMSAVELLYNGKVIARASLDDEGLTAMIDQDVLLDKSGWLAVRVAGKGHADGPVYTLNAHTNPIYVELAGSKTRSREDALYFLKWIDELAVEIRTRDRIPTPELQRHVQAQIQAARTIYTKLAAEEE